MLNKNDEYFQEETLQSCYWAGFLAADGYISENKLCIELGIKDEKHLIKFIQDINWTGQVRYRTRDTGINACRIQIPSAAMYIQKLNSTFGFVKNKSTNLMPPSVVGDKKYAFIVGYIDGDGCVSLDKRGRFTYTRLTITSASPKFRQWIKAELDQLAESSGHLSDISIIYSGKYANRILDKLMSIPVDRLERKWNIRGMTAIEVGRKNIYGDNNPNTKIHECLHPEIIKLHNAGHTQEEIGVRFGVTQSTISKTLRKIKTNSEFVDLEEIS